MTKIEIPTLFRMITDVCFASCELSGSYDADMSVCLPTNAICNQGDWARIWPVGNGLPLALRASEGSSIFVGPGWAYPKLGGVIFGAGVGGATQTFIQRPPM